MKPIVIANPLAAGGRVGREIAAFERAVADRFGPCEVRLSREPGGVERLVRDAADEGARLIGVVGGDGSMGEAVNGILADGRPAPDRLEIVFLPAGTGGDFARAIGMSGWRPDQGLADCGPRRIDVGRVEIRGPRGEPLTRLFANIASAGASAVIAESVNRTSKKLGRLGFVLAALKGLATWCDRRIRLRIDGSVDREMDFNSVVVANGRCFGGGMKVAPNSRLDDGLLDVITIGPVGPGRFLARGRRIYRGTHLDLAEFTEHRGREVRIEAVDRKERPIPVEVDGERPGFLPLVATVVPAALTVIAPWCRAEGIGA